MKIVIRIPTEAYAFHEVSFDSLKEYQDEFIKFLDAYKVLKKVVNKKEEINNDIPFVCPSEINGVKILKTKKK